MVRGVRAALAAVVLIPAWSLLAAAPPGVELVATGYVPGMLSDKSGLTGVICQQGAPATCVPKDALGAFGSDLTYTGHNDVFISAPDRGPFDGLTDVPFLDRVHFFHITTNVATQQVSTLLLDTRFLRNERRFSVRPARSPRIPPTIPRRCGSIRKGSASDRTATSTSRTSTARTCSSSIDRAISCDASRCLRSSGSRTRARIPPRSCSATPAGGRRTAEWRVWPSARTA